MPNSKLICILLYLARIRWSESADINATDTFSQSMAVTEGLSHPTSLSDTSTSSQDDPLSTSQTFSTASLHTEDELSTSTSVGVTCAFTKPKDDLQSTATSKPKDGLSQSTSVVLLTSTPLKQKKAKRKKKTSVSVTSTITQVKDDQSTATSQPEVGLSHTTVMSVTTTLKHPKDHPKLTASSRKKAKDKWIDFRELKASYINGTSESRENVLNKILVADKNKTISSQPHDRSSHSIPPSVTHPKESRHSTVHSKEKFLNSKTSNTTKLRVNEFHNSNVSHKPRFRFDKFLNSKASSFTTKFRVEETQPPPKPLVLFDFSNIPDVRHWYEISDNVRESSKSKAVMTLHKRRIYQQAVFFTLLRPMTEVGFAGVETSTNFDLSKYKKLVICGRAMGNCTGYKVTLRHNNERVPCPSYEQTFTAWPSTGMRTFELPLDRFVPKIRGRLIRHAPPLNLANITRFGLQVYGSVYDKNRYRGVSSMEIDWIKAV